MSFWLEASGVALGLVVARGCRGGAGLGPLTVAIDEACARAKQQSPEALEGRTRQVRDLLRRGKYKPTGRGKPASEYLLAAAREDRFPRISAAVDACNLVSLSTLLPISLVDLDRAGTTELAIRMGRAGESYVFNAGGQVIDLEDLLLVALRPEDRATANPVKDSMATKLGEDARNVCAVIYAPPALASDAARAAEALAGALRDHAGALESTHSPLVSV